VIGNLFDKTVFAIPKAAEYSSENKEYARAGFVLMAALAIRAKKLPDSAFYPFYTL